MKAMIFAAGIGTRLKPITNTKPKALVEAGGKTLLQINIEQLIDFGIKDIVINVHHFSEQIINFLESNKFFNINIQISDESDFLLDTGGGLKKAANLLQGDEPVILKNVDIYSDIDYNKMLEYHIKSGSIATLAVKSRESSRYLRFNSNNNLCGWVNTRTNEKIITRNDKEIKLLAFSGIHIISPQIFDLLPNEQVFGIIQPYLEISKKFPISGYQHDDDIWFDIGSPDKLNKLNQFIKKGNHIPPHNE